MDVDQNELARALLQMYQLGRYRTSSVGHIFLAKDAATLSVEAINTTVQWGLKDIAYYRAVGLHYPYTQGSLIQWNKVEWERYDRGGPREAVLKNLIEEAIR